MVTEVLSTDRQMTLITSGETFIPLTGESGYSLLMLKMDPDASEADVQAAFNAGGGATLRHKPRLCASRKICLKQGKRPRNKKKKKNVLFHIGGKWFILVIPANAGKTNQGECNMDMDRIYAEAIANEYAPKNTSKVMALKKLDRKAKSVANIFAYTFGVVMTLVLGVGMCLSMGVIGGGSTAMLALGVALGIIGLAGVGANYPIYRRLLATGKQKYAFEIIQLAKEIAGESE